VGDQEIIFVVAESPEGGYEARSLGYSIFTEGESLEDLRQMVRDAIAHFDESQSKPSLIRPAHRQGRGHSRLKLPRDISGAKLSQLLQRLSHRAQTGSHIRLTSVTAGTEHHIRTCLRFEKQLYG